MVIASNRIFSFDVSNQSSGSRWPRAFPPRQERVVSALRRPCVISLRQGHVCSVQGVVPLLAQQWVVSGRRRLVACGSCAWAPRGPCQVKGEHDRGPDPCRRAREFSPEAWVGEVTGETFTTSQGCDGARLSGWKSGARPVVRRGSAGREVGWFSAVTVWSAGSGSAHWGWPNCAPVTWRHCRCGRRSGLRTVGDLKSLVSRGGGGCPPCSLCSGPRRWSYDQQRPLAPDTSTPHPGAC